MCACVRVLHALYCCTVQFANSANLLARESAWARVFTFLYPPYPETGKLESGSMSQKGTPLKSPSKSLHRLRMQREKKKYCGEEVGKVHVG